MEIPKFLCEISRNRPNNLKDFGIVLIIIVDKITLD